MGTRLQTFSVHGGPVVRFQLPALQFPVPSASSGQPGSPRAQDANYANYLRIAHSVCSIASDSSVAVVNVREQRVLIVASAHASMVEDVKCRISDSLLLVSCRDGELYVWEMESGSLERGVTGSLAREIFDACDYFTVQAEQHLLVAQGLLFLLNALPWEVGRMLILDSLKCRKCLSLQVEFLNENNLFHLHKIN